MIGWVDRLAFCNIETEPMTPISRSLASFFTRWSGYELNHKVIGPKCYHRCFKIITIITDHYKLDAMESPFLIHNWQGIHFLCSTIDYPLPKETKKHWAIYQPEVDRDKLTAAANLKRPTLETCIHTYMVTFLEHFCPRGKGAMRLSLCEASTQETRPDHNTGNYILPYSFR